MTHFAHPKSPIVHKPTIERSETGFRATCACGWSEAARNQARAVPAFLEHKGTL